MDTHSNTGPRETVEQDVIISGEDEDNKALTGQPTAKHTGSGVQRSSSIEKTYRLQYSSAILKQLADLEHTAPTPATVEKYFTQFGYNLFKGKRFSSSKVVVADDYIIGIGDVITVHIWAAGTRGVTLKANVEPDGTIYLPQVGVLPVAGLSYGDLNDFVAHHVDRYIKGAHVVTKIAQPRSMEVYVLGQVTNPGITVVPAFSTILDALTQAGGPLKTGSLRSIVLRRNGKVHRVLDLYDLILKGETESDILLEDNDSIFVPYIGPTAAVVGAVPNSGIFELKDDKIQLHDLLNYTGQILKQAQFKIFIRRFVDSRNRSQKEVSEIWGGKVLTVESVEYNEQITNFEVINGDLVEIYYVEEYFPPKVYVKGNVWFPQEIVYCDGLKISEILNSPDLLKPDSLTEYALLHTYNTEKANYEIMKIPLGEIMSGQGDIWLEPHDIIEILVDEQKKEFPQTVKIEGQVWQPIEVTHKKGMKLSELLNSPRQLKPKALTDYAVLHRYDEDTAKFDDLKVPLKEVLNGITDIILWPRDVVEILVDSQHEQFPTNVSLEGHVWNPVTLSYKEGIRASMLINDLAQLKPNALTDFAHLYRYDATTADYQIKKVPLYNVIAGLEDFALFPHDKIVVLSKEEYGIKQTVNVKGGVWKPGEFSHSSGMTLKDLIAMGGGLKPNADQKLVEISRQIISNGKTKIDRFRVNMDQSASITIQPYDTVVIPEIHEFGVIRIAKISGEVKNPGEYPLKTGDRISDLIARAGGFLPSAYLYGAKFTSQSAKHGQKVALDNMINDLSLRLRVAQPGEDSETATEMRKSQDIFIEKLKAIEPDGRVAILLTDWETLRCSSFDFELETGDELHIPKKPSYVNVVGSVNNPNALLYQTELTVGDYLYKAGGISKSADSDRIFVVKANGEIISKTQSSIWNEFDKTKLKPGDTIVVPENLERVPYLTKLKSVTEIIYRIAISAGVMGQLFF